MPATKDIDNAAIMNFCFFAPTFRCDDFSDCFVVLNVIPTIERIKGMIKLSRFFSDKMFRTDIPIAQIKIIIPDTLLKFVFGVFIISND